MEIFILVLFAFMYMSLSKVFLLDKVRKDIQFDYNTGDLQTRLYILSILPMLYFGEK